MNLVDILLDRVKTLLPKVSESKLTYSTYLLNVRLLRDLYPDTYKEFTDGGESEKN